MALFFEEIDGKKRRVVLKDSEAPFGGRRVNAAFNYGGETRKKNNFEPGVRAPIVHFTGTKEEPIEIEFHLRDQETGIKGNAIERMALIDSIREASRPLRIVWNNQLRRGCIDKFVAGVEGPGDFKCKLTFDVWDKGEEPSTYWKTIGSISVNIASVSDEFKKIASSLPVPGLDLSALGTMESLISLTFSVWGSVLSLVEDFEAEASDLLGTGDRLSSQLTALMARFINLMAFVEAIDEAFFSEGSDAIDWRIKQAEALEALDRLLSQTYAYGVAVETRVQQVVNADAPEQIYYSRQGDTLESVALKFSVSFEALLSANPGVPIGPLAENTVLRVP